MSCCRFFLPKGVTFDILLRILIGVTLFSAAYIAEVVRGGLQAIPKGQFEGAMAMGLGYWQMMRLVVLPQALRISIPGLVNTSIGLFKDTTLVAIVGLYDFLNIIKASTKDQNWLGLSMEGYVFAAAVYWVFCFGDVALQHASGAQAPYRPQETMSRRHLPCPCKPRYLRCRSPATSMIRMDGVNKWYGQFHVLKDINLTVNKGERIVVCGPSGSGKSTMIRCINRLEEHQKGTHRRRRHRAHP